MPAVTDPVTTIEELLALPEDGLRHELLDGVHAVTPAPSYAHQSVLSRLYSQLSRTVETHSGWQILWSPADIVLGPRTLVQPDLFVIRHDPERAPASWREVGVPVLAIAVLSPSTAARDRVVKRRLYQEAGVSEYWIVDIDSRVIERWRREDDRPEVADSVLEWALDAGPSGSLDLEGLFGPAPV